MQFVHVLDHARRRITVVPSGRLTLDDMLANIERRVAEGAWEYATLYDIGIAPLPSLEDIRRLGTHARALIARLGPSGPLAIVSRSPQADLVARAAADAVLGTVPIRFFSERAEAEAWLDRREDSDRSSRLRLVPGKA